MGKSIQVETWWKGQTHFTVRYELFPDDSEEHTLRDMLLGFDVATFNTTYKAKEYGYDICMGLTDKVDTSYEIRQHLFEDEVRLQKLLGRGDLTAAHREVLTMCLCVVLDAIIDEVWMK